MRTLKLAAVIAVVLAVWLFLLASWLIPRHMPPPT